MIPVTIPDALPIVPTAVVPEDHTPDEVASLRVVVPEVVNVVVPVIAATVGNGLTVTTVVALLEQVPLVPVTV